jgi:hypothetical protein
MKIEEILKHFSGKQKDHGSYYMVCCSAHNDKTPSLQITPRSDGKINFTCYAGCHIDHILNTAGLSFTDIYPKTSPYPRANTKQSILDCEYSYVDEQGEILYVIQKYKKPKGFSAYKLVDGKKISNVSGVRKILYRLPEVLQSDDIFICEGEKSTDAVRDLGVVATCNPFGSGAWRDEYVTYLKDKNVYILPDIDSAGMMFAYRVAASLCGVAKLVKVIDFLDLRFKEDPCDWIDQGGDLTKLWELVRQTSEYHIPENVRRFDKPGWVRVHNWLLEDPELRYKDKLVYLAIAKHADNNSQFCWPSTPLIAKEAGIGRPSLYTYKNSQGKIVEGALDRLVRLGYIKIGKRNMGTRVSNTYTLLHKEEF